MGGPRSHHGNYIRMKIGNSVPFLIIHTKFRGFPGVCACRIHLNIPSKPGCMEYRNNGEREKR